MSETNSGAGLGRVLRVRDLVLFHVVAVVGMRWVAVAGAGTCALGSAKKKRAERP